MRVYDALKNTQKKYPGLPRDVIAQTGGGPGFAEYYPPDEAYNPNPGMATIEARPKSKQLDDDQLEQIMAGDMFHRMPATNKKYAAAKEKYIQSMHPAQLDIAAKMFLDNQERNPEDTRTFPEFIDSTASDAFIRAFMFRNKYPNDFVSGFPVSSNFEQNLPYLMEMEDIARGKQ